MQFLNNNINNNINNINNTSNNNINNINNNNNQQQSTAQHHPIRLNPSRPEELINFIFVIVLVKFVSIPNKQDFIEIFGKNSKQHQQQQSTAQSNSIECFKTGWSEEYSSFGGNTVDKICEY